MNFISDFFKKFGVRKSVTLFVMLFGLGMFEIFNYSTTEFALADVLGKTGFFGLRWATILSIAFCGIDLAGIARLFTPEQGREEPAEVWYLFGAWIMAAAMNATLTWWGVSVSIASNVSSGASIVGTSVVQTVVPIFVALMVWVIRILIVAMLSSYADRMFHSNTSYQRNQQQHRPQPQQQAQQPQQQSSFFGAQSKQIARPNTSDIRRPTRPDPTYASSLRDRVGIDKDNL